MTLIDARWALTEAGWRAGVRIAVDDDGRVASLTDAPASSFPVAASAVNVLSDLAEHRAPESRRVGPEPADHVADFVVPGMPDAHCHAVQHGIAGITERAGGRGDSFWTWRERMYASLAALDAEGLERSATVLYRRLREAGYTSIAEFHYVHRLGPESGRRAALSTALESSAALARAAAAAGVSLLLLPVLYRWGGFGRAELGPRQARFALARDDYRRLFEGLLRQAADPALRGALRIGVAPHSLRACDPDDLRWLMALRAALSPDCPVRWRVNSTSTTCPARSTPPTPRNTSSGRSP